jgi:hypothetical protein
LDDNIQLRLDDVYFATVDGINSMLIDMYPFTGFDQAAIFSI